MYEQRNSSVLTELTLKEKVKADCLTHWGAEDERILNFRERYDAWLAQMPEELQEIVLELLPYFHYYSEISVMEIFRDIHQQLIEDNIVDAYTAMYLPIEKDGGSYNSSFAYWFLYMLKNGINHKRGKASLEKTDGQYRYADLVYIDDCIGTGGTFCEYMEKHAEQLKGKTVVLVVLEAMRVGIEILQEKAKELGINLLIRCKQVSDKAFREDLGNLKKCEAFGQYSKQMGIEKNDIYGYEDSESLMAFYTNSPNNTLGIFIKDVGKKYFSIFPRQITHDVDYKMERLKKQKREKENYQRRKP